MRPISRETIVDRRQPQIRWSAVFAGAVLSTSLWALLQVLGMGVRLAAIDVDHAGNLQGVALGAGTWSFVAPLVALFVGGLLAGRLAGTHATSLGIVHGSVQWAIAAIAGVFVVLSLVAAVVAGVAPASATISFVPLAVSPGVEVEREATLGPAAGREPGSVPSDLEVREEPQEGGPIAAPQEREEHPEQEERAEQAPPPVRRGAPSVRAGQPPGASAPRAVEVVGNALLAIGMLLLLGLGSAGVGGALGARLAARYDVGPRVASGASSPTTLPPAATTVTPGASPVPTPLHDPDDLP